MKKVILVLVICLGFSVTSCKDKEHKHSEETHMHDEAGEHDAKHEAKKTVSNTLYQCPMDCEKGKSYIKEGTCPVCKMDLKAKDVDADSKHEEGHDNDAEHKDNHR